MKHRCNILFILCILLSIHLKSGAQLLDDNFNACTLSKETYAVEKDTLFSDALHVWTIVDENNSTVTDDIATYSVIANGDSIRVSWGNTPGLYKLRVYAKLNFDFNVDGLNFSCAAQEMEQSIVVDGADLRIGTNKTVCYGDSVMLAVSSPARFKSFRWNIDNDTLSTLKFRATSNTSVELQALDNNNCLRKDDLQISLNSLRYTALKIRGEILPDTMKLCEAVTLEADTRLTFAEYKWYRNNAPLDSLDLFNTTMLVDMPLSDALPITYKVDVSNTEDGVICNVSDSVVVYPCENPVSQVVLTPNGDGLNDRWDLSPYPGSNVEIYDRWGRIVFKSSGSQSYFDGRANNRDLPMGQYYYIIKLSNKKNALTGYVLIIR